MAYPCYSNEPTDKKATKGLFLNGRWVVKERIYPLHSQYDDRLLARISKADEHDVAMAISGDFAHACHSGVIGKGPFDTQAGPTASSGHVRLEVWCQEAFALVVSIVPYRELEEAIALVNRSVNGLNIGWYRASNPKPVRSS